MLELNSNLDYVRTYAVRNMENHPAIVFISTTKLIMEVYNGEFSFDYV